ncbi:MAG: hypothetical protein H6730_36935 [Deltaproteobacteria bacterium]|nr:hypothetical protein [Deltaproteobacteria bacterium]
MKTPLLVALIFAGLIASACGPEGSFDDGLDDEEIGTTSSALINVDPCAMGTTANATGTLYTPGDYESYTRSAAWINSICPALGKDRKTTMVDFFVSANNSYWYGFGLQPTFIPASNATECTGQLAALRLMRRDKQTMQWVEVEYLESKGQWTLSGCRSPQIVTYSQNSFETYHTHTDVYRVRAIAKNADGTYATVFIRGFQHPPLP